MELFPKPGSRSPAALPAVSSTFPGTHWVQFVQTELPKPRPDDENISKSSSAAPQSQLLLPCPWARRPFRTPQKHGWLVWDRKGSQATSQGAENSALRAFAPMGGPPSIQRLLLLHLSRRGGCVGSRHTRHWPGGHPAKAPPEIQHPVSGCRSTVPEPKPESQGPSVLICTIWMSNLRCIARDQKGHRRVLKGPRPR